MSMNDPLSLYIHIPFCVSRCSYCDFTTFAGKKELIPEYIEALKLEIEINSDLLCLQNPVHSIYFGGGTPSNQAKILFHPKQFRKTFRLMQMQKSHWK